MGLLEEKYRCSGPPGPGGGPVVSRRGATQPRFEMVGKRGRALPANRCRTRPRPRRKPRPGISWQSARLSERPRPTHRRTAKRPINCWKHAAAVDREASRWFAQIMNSLAKELRKGTAEEQVKARALFQRRLQMEKERSLGDLRGVAMALGGLGRLEWFARAEGPASRRAILSRESRYGRRDS